MSINNEVKGGKEYGRIMLHHFELDRRIGGLPYPTLTLIEGDNDSGKSVLVQQVAYGAVKDTFSVRYITTENTIKSLLRHMENLNFNVKSEFLTGKFRVTELQVLNLSWNRIISRRYLALLLRLIERDIKSDVYIVDSLTYIATHASGKDLLEFFTMMRNIVDDNDKAVFITLHPDAFSDDLLIRIRSISGGHIILRTVESGGRMVRVININKLRGSERGTNLIISFEVDPAFGIKILPFSQAKA